MVLRIGLFGDVVGRAGRAAVADHLPALKAQLKLDLTVLNIENAASGFGYNAAMVAAFEAAGVDALLTGNHAFDHKDSIHLLSSKANLIRPANYPPGTPGRGLCELMTPKGPVVILQLMARLFMAAVDCPFQTVDALLKTHRLGHTCKAILVDIHGEATSEKMALGHYLDGRVTVVEGTHTHVPTADTMILPKGTAYQSDLGMTGDYHSVIGFDPEIPIRRFVTGRNAGRLTPALGSATLTGLYVEADLGTGLAVKASPLRVGGKLSHAHGADLGS